MSEEELEGQEEFECKIKHDKNNVTAENVLCCIPCGRCKKRIKFGHMEEHRKRMHKNEKDPENACDIT